MRNILAFPGKYDIKEVAESVEAMAKSIQEYVPGYELT